MKRASLAIVLITLLSAACKKQLADTTVIKAEDENTGFARLMPHVLSKEITDFTDPSRRHEYHQKACKLPPGAREPICDGRGKYPWVLWQWLPGNRVDPDPDTDRNRRFVGVARGVIELDGSRAELVSLNLADTEGTFGRSPKIDRSDAQEWTQMNSGKICDVTENDAIGNDVAVNCETIRNCGPADMSNRRYRARTLNGTCNDFNNAMMGSVGMRMARNAVERTPPKGREGARPDPFGPVNRAFDDFEKNGGGGPDPFKVANEILVRQSPDMHAPAPHFNMWAAAWIQFMTHDWFSHSVDGYNSREKSLPVRFPDGRAIPATRGRQFDRGIQDRRCRIIESQGGRCVRPKQAFHNNQTHWWDASQLYGWDKESMARVRIPRSPYLRVDSDGRLPEIFIEKYGLKQEAAGFIDNWWVGLSLLHNLFSRNHNNLVDQLCGGRYAPGSAPCPNARERAPGNAAWSAERLFDTARLINAALIAKIHTVEWTPQLLFNNLGMLVLQSNWHGLANFGTTEIQQFRKAVGQSPVASALSNHISRLVGRFQAPRCLVTPSLLGSFAGIGNLEKPEHFCSPFALPEEFTTVYRLHMMMPDKLDLYDADGKVLSKPDLDTISPSLPIDATGRLPTAATLREKSYDLMQERQCGSGRRCFGIKAWAQTFGHHPCGQLTANNFPVFLSELETPAPPAGKINMAAIDIIRDRERGVPRFNEFRKLIGLKELRDFDDFIDRELEYEVNTGTTRAFGGKRPRKLNSEQIAVRRAVLQQQHNIVETLKMRYKHINDVDVQVGIAAEFVRPHGFVISETQFQIFILNASRRLFSDRFFVGGVNKETGEFLGTGAFNERFYTKFGMDYLRKTFFLDVLNTNFGMNLARKDSRGNDRNGFELWDRQVDGFSLCTDGSSWYDKHPGVKKTYRALFCLKDTQPVAEGE